MLSGSRPRRGAINKVENQSIRFVLGEAGWAYRFQLAVRETLRKRHEGLDPEVIHISTKAQRPLCLKCRKLVHRGKQNTVEVTAVARELIGFVGAIACGVRGQI